MSKLPEQAKNKIDIKLHPSQINLDNTSVDHRIFPKTSFNIIYGSRFTGKSILISNLIKDFYLEHNAFGSYIILTPTSHDKAWNVIRSRKKFHILNKCTDDLLFDLMETQEAAIAERNCKHVLRVIDDFACQGKGLKALEEIAIRGRHLKLTVIITLQYVKLLPPAVRRNANGVVLFKMGDDEIETLGREGLRCLVDLEEFINWVKNNTHEPR